MKTEYKEIIKKSIEQTINNAIGRGIWPPLLNASFFGGFLKKSPGKYLDLTINSDSDGRIKVLFKLENYKKLVSIDIENIFERGIFWTEFFDVDEYREVSKYIKQFEKLNGWDEKANFLNKYLKKI